MNVIIHVINILLGGEILCYFLYCQKIISVFLSFDSYYFLGRQFFIGTSEYGVKRRN